MTEQELFGYELTKLVDKLTWLGGSIECKPERTEGLMYNNWILRLGEDTYFFNGSDLNSRTLTHAVDHILQRRWKSE